jgi:hypothetical protein
MLFCFVPILLVTKQETEEYKTKILELRDTLKEMTQQLNYMKEAVNTDTKVVPQTAANNSNGPALTNSMRSLNGAYLSNTFDIDPLLAATSHTLSSPNSNNTYNNNNNNSGSKKSPGTRQRSQSAAPSLTNRPSGQLQRTNSVSSNNGGWNDSVRNANIPDIWGSGDDGDNYNNNNNNSSNNNFNNTVGSNASVASSSSPRGTSIGGGGSLTRMMSSSNNLSTLHKGGLSIVAPVNWLLIFRAEVQKALDELRCREMTLNETKETLNKLYQSKVIANEKANRGIGMSADFFLHTSRHSISFFFFTAFYCVSVNVCLSVAELSKFLFHFKCFVFLSFWCCCCVLIAGNVPLDTMEQHVFRVYEAKYGLRSIAVEHAGAFVRSLLLHSPADNDVMVFLKIFRNELEEEFRFIQAELYASIKDLTMVQLMSRFPSKDSAAIAALLEQKMGQGVVYEEEWVDMVHYLYNAADSTTLCVLLKKLAVVEREKITYFDSPGGVNKAPVSVNGAAKVVKTNTAYVMESSLAAGAPLGYDKRSNKDVKRLGYASPTLQIAVKDTTQGGRKDMLKLPFTVFLRTVLDFQLQSHLRYLSFFVKVFRELDRDVDGVINAAEFKECFIRIRRGNNSTGGGGSGGGNGSNASVGSSGDITEDELKLFLTIIVSIDPLQTDRVTFSSAVASLSKLTSE